MEYTPTVRQGYTNLWRKAEVLPAYDNAARLMAEKLNKYRDRYVAIEKTLGVPWWWIACIHERESDCDFKTYLGNGEPLNRRTRLVPKGRGPFATWEEGAEDALRLEDLDKVTDWSIPHALYLAEKYNGWGYLGKINSPYIWSWTNLYSRGKYVFDGRYSPTARDQQPGVAAMLKGMIEQKIIPDFEIPA